jgi:UDP-2-acetamido-3-amino-2,3-dideoxy-glucuronate N-acetyltransferase
MKKKFRVHESSYVDKNVRIGDGTSVWYFCHIMEGAEIGRNCNIGQNVFIDKNVVIGDSVKIQNNVSVYWGVEVGDGAFLGPSCVFTNVKNPRSLHPRDKNEFLKTKVGIGATLGANCTIVCGNNIGNHAFVGAGAVITRDVPDYALVVGNPGRIIGWLCECGTRLNFGSSHTAKCPVCGLKYKENKKCIEKKQ